MQAFSQQRKKKEEERKQLHPSLLEDNIPVLLKEGSDLESRARADFESAVLREKKRLILEMQKKRKGKRLAKKGEFEKKD